MPVNFFITGAPKAGKTTLLSRLAKDLNKKGLKVGGYLTPADTESGSRKGFHIVDIESGKTAMLAGIGTSGPKVGKYRVDVKSFEELVLPIMKKKYDVIILDEIGIMELKSQKFAQTLDELLDSQRPLIASIRQEYVGRYGTQGEVSYLTGNNYESVYNEMKETVLGAIKPTTNAPGKKPEIRSERASKAQIKTKESKEKKTINAKIEPTKDQSRTKSKEINEKPKKVGFFEKLKNFIGI